MADPTTIGQVGLGSSLVGTAFSAFGSIVGGQAQSKMFQYQAGVADLNSQIAKQNASYAIQKGEVEAQSSGMKTRYQVGETTTAEAASGIDVNKGSAVAVRASEMSVGNMDQAIIRSNAAKEAYGYRVQGLMDTEQARIDRFAASNASTAGYIGAASSILGGAGSVASKWAQGQSVGLYNG